MPKKEPTIELVNIDEPSKAIKLYKITPAEIAAKLKDYDHLKVIEGDTGSYKEVRAALTILVHTRTGIDAHRLQLGVKLRKSLGHINKAGGMLIEPMTPYEERFNSELKAEDDRKTAIKKEKVEKEQARKDDIRAKITQIAIMQNGLQTMGLKELKGLSDRLEPMEIGDDYMEFKEEAEKVIDDSYNAVQQAISARIKLDKEAEERKAEDERLEKLRNKLEAVKKKADATQKKIDDEKAKLAADKKEAQDKKDQFRIDALFSTGLMWDGEGYCFMDVNVHWTDIVILSDDEFNHFIDDIRSKIKIQREEEAERIAKEAKDKADGERIENERAEEVEKERKAAMAPDREKLTKWIHSFDEATNLMPQLKSKKAKEILRIAWEGIGMVLQDAMNKVVKL